MFQGSGTSTAGACAACPDSNAASCGADGSRVGTGCNSETGAGYACTKFADIDPKQCGPGQERVGLTTASVDKVQDLQYSCKDCVNSETYKVGTNPDQCQPCKNIRCGSGTRRQGTCSGGKNGFTCPTCPTKTFKVGSTEATTCDLCNYKDGDGTKGCKAQQFESGSCSGAKDGFQCNVCGNIRCGKGRHRTGDCSGRDNGCAKPVRLNRWPNGAPARFRWPRRSMPRATECAFASVPV